MKIISGFVLAASLLVSTSVFPAEVNHVEIGLVHANMLHGSGLSEEYNGIKVGDWVKTNSDYNNARGSRIAGKVVKFKYVGEAYPVAILRGGKEVSVFWLEKMRTQNRS